MSPRLVERLNAVLEGVAWQAIFVDDDSPDAPPRRSNGSPRAIRASNAFAGCRRRGLAGAVVEGALASAAPFVGVIRRRPAA